MKIDTKTKIEQLLFTLDIDMSYEDFSANALNSIAFENIQNALIDYILEKKSKEPVAAQNILHELNSTRRKYLDSLN